MSKLLLTSAALAAAVSASALVAAPAHANIDIAVGDTIGTTETEIVAALDAMGLKADEIEFEDGMIEVEIETADGEYELEVSAESGVVQEIELEAEDGDDDDDDDDNG